VMWRVFVFSVLLALSLFFSLRKYRKRRKIKLLYKKSLKDPYDFESFACHYLREKGFKDVRLTRKSKDFGADVLGRKGRRLFVFQVKRWNHPVGKEIVKELIMAAYVYGAEGVGVFTNNSVSRGLWEELEKLKGKGFIKEVIVVSWEDLKPLG